ncbi:MAG: CsiV family protein, partial [Gammaproteobacteria bacterium]
MIRALRSPASAAIRTLAGLGFAAIALAQAPEPAPGETAWVQYEVIAFRPMEPMTSDETWPVEVLPGYPPQIGFLLEPGSPAHEAALRAREFEQSLQAEAGTAAEPLDPLAAELPRLRLSGVDMVLAPAADRIGNSREYRLLGHYAWRQPLPAPGQAEHLLVTGGAASGDHFELEGYITLSRSRFLHVDTTLWLNELLPPGSPAPEGSVELPALPKPQLPEQEPLSPEAAPPLD